MSDDKKEVVVPEKFHKLVSEIEKLSVLDLSELVHVLEEKFGVSAAAPIAVAAPAAAGAGAAEAVEEKSSFNVELTDAGSNKMGVIKVLREVTTLGLKELKDLVDSAPKVVKEGATKEEAGAMKKKLEEAGAKVSLK